MLFILSEDYFSLRILVFDVVVIHFSFKSEQRIAVLADDGLNYLLPINKGGFRKVEIKHRAFISDNFSRS